MTQLRAAPSALVAVACGLAAGCSPSVTTTTRPHETSAPPASASTTAAATAPADLTCGTPAKPLVEQAKVGIASHPGPVLATTLVPAATTDTGTWSVLGIDRAFARDDGTTSGDSSRDFALVNVAPDGDGRMIPISSGDWSAVSWRGDTLAAGKRALAFADACLAAGQAGDAAQP